MSRFKYHKPDLRNRRDASIIMHVFRNRLSKNALIHDLFFQELSADTSRKVISRLVRTSFLSRYPLFGNKTYLRLGPRAVQRWGYPRSRTGKLGTQRLPYEFGALAYNCLGPYPRKRLLPHELKRRFPWFPLRLMQWAYIAESDRLGTIRVEHRGRPQRIIAKLADQLYRYGAKPEFRELIEAGRFFVVVVTATEHQELALQEQAVDQQFPVELRTAHYPDLIYFI